MSDKRIHAEIEARQEHDFAQAGQIRVALLMLLAVAVALTCIVAWAVWSV